MSPKRPPKKNSVLFVCAANQCRSPMAAAIFRDLTAKRVENPDNWIIDSAGVWAGKGYPATDFAHQTMGYFGLDLSDHRSQSVNEALLGKYKLVLCMEEDQVASIKKYFPKSKGKVFLLSEMQGEKEEIWDPAGFSLDAYQDTANEILSILEEGFDKISQLSK